MKVSKPISAKALLLDTPSEAFNDGREPPLAIGNLVRLNSGGPAMIVVDFDDGSIVAAWRDPSGKARESTLPTACVHRYNPSVIQSSI